ncbi:MAG: cation transporter [Bacillota bacterium]|nr:cation transporter [Bacillota bacterium]
MATAIICGILLVFCFIGIRSSVKRIAHGCCGSGGDEVKKVKVQDRDLSHYPYSYGMKVEGMTCSNCKKRVENAFNEKEGFWAKVDLKENSVQVYSKQQVPKEELRAIVRKAGYQPGEILINK